MKKVGAAHSIQVASDGQLAIDYLQGAGKFADRATFPLPSLILLDLKLPHVMGLEVLKWIRAQRGSPPIVVVLTASANEADIAVAYRLGANAFLVKPSEARKLEEMARSLHEFWFTCNTPPVESPTAEGAAFLSSGEASDAELLPSQFRGLLAKELVVAPPRWDSIYPPHPFSGDWGV